MIRALIAIVIVAPFVALTGCSQKPEVAVQRDRGPVRTAVSQAGGTPQAQPIATPRGYGAAPLEMTEGGDPAVLRQLHEATEPRIVPQTAYPTPRGYQYVRPGVHTRYPYGYGYYNYPYGGPFYYSSSGQVIYLLPSQRTYPYPGWSIFSSPYHRDVTRRLTYPYRQAPPALKTPAQMFRGPVPPGQPRPAGPFGRP